MAKITISQLNAASIQELTNAELDATKGGLLNGLTAVVTPNVDAKNTAVGGQVGTVNSSNGLLQGIGQSIGIFGL